MSATRFPHANASVGNWLGGFVWDGICPRSHGNAMDEEKEGGRRWEYYQSKVLKGAAVARGHITYGNVDK